jgi:Mg/Co/Ni transporter MgtE
MRIRNYQPQEAGTKGFSLAISYKGKNYSICDNEQFKYLSGRVRENIVMDFAKEEKQITEEELEELVAAQLEEAGYALLKTVLAKMTPEEAAQWKQSYRFAPLSRRKL